MALKNKRILVGLGGSVAAFKTVELVRIFRSAGAEVRVAMTAAATRFVGTTTFAAITGRAVATDLWEPNYPGEIHIELAHWAELMVVAPATANLMARAVAGMADDLLLTTLLCAGGPVYYAPAMHERMWLSPATQRNARQLREMGARFIGPVKGLLANGQEGLGRMAEPQAIAEAIEKDLAIVQDLSGKCVLVSAGPTVEDLDPVRFLSNRSSGRMGYALARQAVRRGARTILVSGPVAIEAPGGAELVPVRSALEMQAAIAKRLPEVDAVIMCAAVADYRPKTSDSQKIKKGATELQLEMVKNPDILAELGQGRRDKRPVLVGFALETHNVVEYARKKLVDKKVDLIVANDASVGFGGNETKVTFVALNGNQELPPMSKDQTADRIIDRLVALLS
jgi:phosphopantothenoylcysteine decarboxylase / phosphopantothenate---cysteine ligase